MGWCHFRHDTFLKPTGRYRLSLSSDCSPARDHRFFPQSFKGQSGVFGSTLIDLNPEETSQPKKKGSLPVSVRLLCMKNIPLVGPPGTQMYVRIKASTVNKARVPFYF